MRGAYWFAVYTYAWAFGKSVFYVSSVHDCGPVPRHAHSTRSTILVHIKISIILECSVAACNIAATPIILRFVECLPIITRISCVRLLVRSQSFSECGRDQS